jgi:hypothetical protein
MKKILLILIVFSGSSIVYCQSLKPSVIASAGSFAVNASNSVSWTIGECIIETFSGTNSKLTQGFQQGFYEITTSIDNTLNLIKVNLYPNPASDFINLEIELQSGQEFSYDLYDLNGKSLQNRKIISERSEIRLSDYTGSAYILNVYSKDKKLVKSFKILKIN